MKPSRHSAFTLIELLVVITIIAVLAGIALPIFGSIQLSGKRTQSLNNMRQLAVAALNYASDNDGSLPTQGDKTVTWTSAAANTAAENAQWYNILPRQYGNGRGLGDYATNTAAYYTKASMFYVPAAQYPTTKLSAPLFAVVFNSKLETSTYTNVRLQLIQLPAETVLFQESGLPGETPLKGQSAYTNQSYGYASRLAARYSGNTLLAFLDGHVGEFPGSSIVNTSGQAYFVAYPGAFPTGAATVYWEMLPTVSPN